MQIIPRTPKSSVYSPGGRRGPIAHHQQRLRHRENAEEAPERVPSNRLPKIMAKQKSSRFYLSQESKDKNADSRRTNSASLNKTLDTIGNQLFRFAQTPSLYIEIRQPDEMESTHRNDHAPAGGTLSCTCNPSTTTRGRRATAHDKPPC